MSSLKKISKVKAITSPSRLISSDLRVILKYVQHFLREASLWSKARMPIPMNSWSLSQPFRSPELQTVKAGIRRCTFQNLMIKTCKLGKLSPMMSNKTLIKKELMKWTSTNSNIRISSVNKMSWMWAAECSTRNSKITLAPWTPTSIWLGRTSF